MCLGTSCESIADCDEPGMCISSVSCEEGCCKYKFMEAGTACGEGCEVNGTCDGTGSCVGTEPKECPETDGSVCTQPACDSVTGECVEEPIADGAEPYTGSDCWEGAVCMGGDLDSTNATPTEKALECQGKTDEVDPLGCIQKYLCVNAQEECQLVPKVEGTQCWEGEGADGDTCLGRACDAEGACLVDHEFDVTCGDDDFPDECDEGCKQCTGLECHWIVDPAFTPPEDDPDQMPSKKVRYCQPAALVGDSCDDGDGCTLEDQCGMGSQADGPIGKETLGVCVAGADKECPDPTCATGLCDPDSGECGFTNQDDDWCSSFSSCLVNTDDNKCDPKHPDADAETGCVFIWMQAGTGCEINDACVNAAECVEKPNSPGQFYCQPTDQKTCPDDGNPCTEDQCQDVDGKATCLHVPDDTLVCEDSNLCTINLCVDGVCTTTDEMVCDDNDGNICNGPQCVPETGECIYEPMGDGDACGYNGICVTATCQGGVCIDVPLVSDGSPDLPNGLDDDCDGKIDENGYLLWGVNGSAFVAGSELSGDDAYTVKSVLGDTQAAPEFEASSTDGKYTLRSGLPTMAAQ